MYTIQKEFRFEAAHRLSHSYEGKCANIHGHSYRVEVVLGSTILDDVGMVRDFSELQPFGTWLSKHFDHKLVLSQDDPLAIHTLHDGVEGIDIALMVGNPTAENMATLFASKLYDLLPVPDTVRVVAVHVWETVKCCGTWRNSGLEV